MDANKIESIYPLAPQQQGVFLESRASSGTGLHIEQVVRTFVGTLDLPALERAWQHVVDRHPMLRTAFVWKGQEEPVQVVLRSVTAQVMEEDWRHLAPEVQQERLEEFLEADRRRGFELHRPPLGRLVVLQMEENVYEIVQTFHHILIDGWSMPLISQDLARYYTAFRKGDNVRIEPATPYRNYVAWLKKQDAACAEAYWRKALDTWRYPTPIGRIAESVARTDEPQTYGYAESELNEQATEALQAMARRSRVTMSTILQAAWALLLSRYSGEQDVLFGTTVSGRPDDLPGIETTVGLFVNTLPFRVSVPVESSLIAWLQAIQAEHLESRQYEYCSTGQIHQWSQIPAAFPMFESVLVYENYPQSKAIDGSEEKPADRVQHARAVGAQTKYALALLAGVGKHLMFRMTYDRRRFDSEGANRIVEHILDILNRMAAGGEGALPTYLAGIPEDQIPAFRPLQPAERADRPDSEATAPRTPTEAIVADICAEVLGLTQIDVFDNLLELGAHSLSILQMAARIRSVLKTELPLSAVFDAPTIAGIARVLQSRQRAGSQAGVAALQPVKRDRTLPLSFAQQRLWLLDQLNPGQAFYNSTANIRLVGPLELSALEASFTEIVARHESLRTVFQARDEEPVQVVLPPQPVPLPFTDLRTLADDGKKREVERLMQEEAQKPFDLSRDLMLRASVLCVNDEDHLLLLTLHHIASDRWSFDVLLRELRALYEAFKAGQPSPLPELPLQYADYAVWERETLHETVYASQLDYWRKQLADVSSDPILTTDYPRPEQPVYAGDIHTGVLSKAPSEALQKLARQGGCSLYMTLLAAFHIQLRYLSGQETIATGANVANRTHVELEGLIGFFVNQIVLRSDLSGNPTFREFLGRMREVVLEGYAHQEVPFDMVVADQKRKRALNMTPLFQVLFVQNPPLQPAKQSELRITPLATDATLSRFELAVFSSEFAEGIAFGWQYKTDLFSQATISKMVSQYVALLEHIAANSEASLADLNHFLTEFDGQLRRTENRARAEFGKSLFKKVAVKAVQFEPDQTQ